MASDVGVAESRRAEWHALMARMITEMIPETWNKRI